MDKRRRLSIIGLVVLGLMYIATIVIGILGHTMLTIVFLAGTSIISIIIFFVLKNIERNNNEAAMLLDEGRKNNFPEEDDQEDS